MYTLHTLFYVVSQQRHMNDSMVLSFKGNAVEKGGIHSIIHAKQIL